jgi:AcrR family transcriptional regulator
VKTPTRAQLARAGRKERIVAAAREIAEAEGWGAVTVRRLADSIGFSQPVLYGHFPDGREGIVRAVALDGFARIAVLLTADGRDTVRGVASGYLDFARESPAVYEAMFSLPTDLAFATAAPPEELLAAFGALAAVAGGDESRTETMWAALHGLAELARRGRLRPTHYQKRLDLLVELFTLR